MTVRYEETLVKEEDIGGGYVKKTYKLDPPQPWLQRNLNEMFPELQSRRITIIKL